MRIFQVSVVFDPFCTLVGLATIAHEGGSTGGGGGTTLAVAVTEAVQLHVPAVLFVVIVYCVVALGGGMIVWTQEIPRGIFPGLRTPVVEFCSDQERDAPEPLVTVDGLIAIVQVGATVIALSERRAK